MNIHLKQNDQYGSGRTTQNNRSDPVGDLKLSAQYVLTVKSLRTKRHNDLKFLVQYAIMVAN